MPSGGGIIHWWPLSVCPCLTLSRERKGIDSWKLVGRKPMTRVIHDPIYWSKGQISHIFGMGRPMNFKLGIQMEYDDSHHRCAVTSNLKALGGCSSHHLQGAGYVVAAPLHATHLVGVRILHVKCAFGWPAQQFLSITCHSTVSVH